MGRFRIVRAMSISSILLLALGLMFVPEVRSAAEPQMLNGDMWQTMSRDTKIAYIWGIGNLIDLERTQLEEQQIERPTPERKSYIPYLARGLRGLSIDEIIDRVDAYYRAYPQERNRPVLDAIFQSIVIPQLQAEAGREPPR